MAIEDGDPRILVPDLFNRLTFPERKLAVNYFQLRLRGKGKNESPDEAPASVARKALVLGSYSCFLYLAVYPCVALILYSAIAGANEAVILGSMAALFALGAAAGALRHRQINRYFDEQLPGGRG